jgi:hypothetical protein
VDVASRVIVQVGFPVVVAAWLLWFLLTKFQANMDVITARMQANAQVIESFVEQLQAAMAEERAQTTELKTQTAELKAQSLTLHGIAKDAESLVGLRRQELEWMRAHKP